MGGESLEAIRMSRFAFAARIARGRSRFPSLEAASIAAPSLESERGGIRFTIAFILAALNGRGPFPLLAFSGEQGTAKSTMSKVVRALMDPSSAPGRTPPREENQIKIAAVLVCNRIRQFIVHSRAAVRRSVQTQRRRRVL